MTARPTTRGARRARRSNALEREADWRFANGALEPIESIRERARKDSSMVAKQVQIITVSISAIRSDGGTQARAGLDEDTVEEYTELLREKEFNFPPVDVYGTGDGPHPATYWLADGFHRLEAHRRAGREFIQAKLHIGGQREAILHAVGANAAHGKRRTNADKRRAVQKLLEDPEWSMWSDREIARQCKVHHQLVATVRKDVGAHLDDHPDRPARKVERAGTVYTLTIPTSRAPSVNGKLPPRGSNRISYGPVEDEFVDDLPPVPDEEVDFYAGDEPAIESTGDPVIDAVLAEAVATAPTPDLPEPKVKIDLTTREGRETKAFFTQQLYMAFWMSGRSPLGWFGAQEAEVPLDNCKVLVEAGYLEQNPDFPQPGPLDRAWRITPDGCRFIRRPIKTYEAKRELMPEPWNWRVGSGSQFEIVAADGEVVCRVGPIGARGRQVAELLLEGRARVQYEASPRHD